MFKYQTWNSSLSTQGDSHLLLVPWGSCIEKQACSFFCYFRLSDPRSRDFFAVYWRLTEMHPPVRWNALSDGQPDNGTTLPIRMWSGGKNTGGLCFVRSSIQAHAQGWPHALCIPVCGGQGILLKRRVLMAGKESRTSSNLIIRASSGEVTGLERDDVSYVPCTRPHFKLMEKDLETQFS